MTLINPKYLYPMLLLLCLFDFANRFISETPEIKRAGADEFKTFNVRQNIGDVTTLRKLYLAAADSDGISGSIAADTGKFDSFTANGQTVALVAIYEADQRVAVLSVKTERQKPVVHRLHKDAEIAGYKLVELDRQRIVLQSAQHSKTLKLFTPQKSNKDQ